MSIANDYEQWAEEYYIEEYETLRGLVISVLRNSRDERIDSLLSDAVLKRLPGVLRTWKPAKGDLTKHIEYSLKWYIYKQLVREDICRNRSSDISIVDETQLITTNYDPSHNIEIIEQFEKLEKQLPRKQMKLLRRRYMDGLSVVEIADILCVSRGTVYVLLREAEHVAREILSAGNVYAVICEALRDV